MALFAAKLCISPSHSFVNLRFSPPTFAFSQTNYAPLWSKTPRLTICVECSSQPGSNPAEPDDFDSSDNIKPINFTDDSVVNSPNQMSFDDLSEDTSRSVSANGALIPDYSPQIDPSVQQQQLRETLSSFSQSLELLSSTIAELATAVRVLSASVGSQPSSVSSSPPATDLPPIELRVEGRAEASEISSDPPEIDDTSVFAAPDGEIHTLDDVVPPYLVEQNNRAHKLAYKLQRAFIQARIEGLGKPFQVAVDEFVDLCIDAHVMGMGLKELQLQLVLQDGSLSGAFAIRNQKWSNDPIMTEESRIRSLWVRLVYSTLAQLGSYEIETQQADPTDLFVKEVVNLALEKGFDLERIKLEQTFAGLDVTSGAVKAIRENQYIVLLTLDKAKGMNK